MNKIRIQWLFWSLVGLMLCLPLTAAKRTVHTIGDSTMSDYKPAATPKRGWGMYLQAFFNADSVTVNNRGKSGASTRTFYETDNLWPSVKRQMQAGDYLIIQFAHNDEKCKGEDVYVRNAELRAEGKDTLTDMRGTDPNTTYKEFLRLYVHEAREAGVTPILMAPICRAYFKDGKINNEGRHVLSTEKDYVRSMQEVADELDVPFLNMTEESRQTLESFGQEFCMAHFFNCGDKTHTSADGGMAMAMLAYQLLSTSPACAALHPWLVLPSAEDCARYALRIEDAGKQAAFDAPGMHFDKHLSAARAVNMVGTKNGYLPIELEWPAGEIDEVANRYVEFELTAPKKKALVIESLSLPIRVKGGEGMNIHINYGFGEQFSDVTTIYENTALPKNKKYVITLTQPIMVPAGTTIHLRVLPWYDSNGRPQTKKFIQIGEMLVSGKMLF